MGRESSPPIDRLSYLPHCLIQYIFTHLPLRDAVKTSILSTEWRNKWLLLTHLNFDESFCRKFVKNNRLSKTKLFKTIYQVLLAHCDHPIHKITLSFWGINVVEDCPEIDFIVYQLSKSNIQELTLDFPSISHRRLMSSYLFSCVNLKYIELNNCVCIPTSSFQGFNLLTILRLGFVDFTGYNFEAFLSKCPLLEELWIEYCNGTEDLVIDAPNLCLLYYEGFIESISFKSTTVLTRVIITCFPGPHISKVEIKDINWLFSCLHLMEKFVLEYQFLTALAEIPESQRLLLAPLSNLKCLEIRSMCFAVSDTVSGALCLMRSCPNLTQLSIKAIHVSDGSGDAEILGILGTLDSSNTVFHRLLEVKMFQFEGTQPVIEFLRIILARSPMFQTLHFEYCMESDANEKLRSLIELTRLERASPRAKIIFS